ncbi:nucleoporin nup53 [Acrodontium crateriforme]|uniref:Nucleoporin nup53 n=1 Tax=Acrodontium crateriforme TaxID=150365 RepID=A0AAQ3LWP1_9PEZI|nr:nucleoporin nup53 [Acrodontium crateriforme]
MAATFNQSPRAYRGMQVHAVPENERAFDPATGRKLPWGYLAGDASDDPEHRRELAEKGPFGRSTRRARWGSSRSRSKTAEPNREEDRLRAEQLAAEDAVFGSLRRIVKDEPRRDGLGEKDPSSTSAQTPTTATFESEPQATEVLLYGFGEDLQWSAIEFYERVSEGSILEDYDRQPVGYRGLDISKSFGRMAMQKSLSKDALRKKNRFAGGHHWIKVTFQSQQAAELACARSPHVLKGHLVYAEPYVGRGPGKDEPIPASNAGAQIYSEGVPKSFSTNTMTGDNGNGSPGGSSTLTSATATNATTAGNTRPQLSFQIDSRSPPLFGSASGLEQTQSNSETQLQQRRSRIAGATQAVLLPPERALMPKQPRQSWWSSFGARELIGTTVPRKEDGTFDWDRASFYWRLFCWLDLILGTDMCGLRGDE